MVQKIRKANRKEKSVARASAGAPGATWVDSMNPHLYVPTPQRPLRAKYRKLAAATRVRPHAHPWAQFVVSARGTLRLDVPTGAYLVPPFRALWIPPGIEHAVTVVEDAWMHTVYVHQHPGGVGPHAAAATTPGWSVDAAGEGKGKGEGPGQDPDRWQRCRVLHAGTLLRTLVAELSTDSDADRGLSDAALAREHHLSELILDEMQRARAVRIGVDLPADRRLRSLCEAVLNDPLRHSRLEDWAKDIGASSRTVARLFQEQLGSTFTQWRQQVLLARAVGLAARGMSIGRIASELGYGASAFSAMIRKNLGESPSELFAANALTIRPSRAFRLN